MTLAGIDVSYAQTAKTLTSWLPRVAFVIAKASQGIRIADNMHASHVVAARKAGKLVGHYHYAEPAKSSAAAEARFFLAAAKPQPGDVLILDFEPYNQNGRVADYPEWVLAFTAAVKAATGAPCWLYVNGDWGNQLLAAATAAQDAAIRALPLWKAEYHGGKYGAPRGANPNSLLGWSTWTAWQHTDVPLDTDLFNGDAAAWRALAVPTPTQPGGFLMALSDQEQADLLATVKSLATKVDALTAAEAGRYATATGRYQQTVGMLSHIPTGQLTAKDIADAIPDGIAQEVITALGAKLNTPPTS